MEEYHNRKRFFNPYRKYTKRHFWNVILWKLGFYNEPIKRALPPHDFEYSIKKSFNNNYPSCTWINHCTFLITLNNINILTDPIFSKYCAPFPLSSLRRRHELSIQIHDLPKINYVLISHNHYDHLDHKSVIKLNGLFPDIKWILPLELSKWFVKRKIKNILELDWWQSYQLDKNIKITAVPSQHFSGRGLFSMNKTLWNGYVVDFREENKKFYFTGDTGYNEFDFVSIGEKLGPMDLSLIPIGTYCPRPFMQPVHVDPAEAVLVHQEVRSKFSIGMHWKTFKLSDEPLNLPPFDLFHAMKNAKLNFDEFMVLEPGEDVNW
jgi:N-acyl-phosphatidylethanolamine-hydrolysing phospholipase D